MAFHAVWREAEEESPPRNIEEVEKDDVEAHCALYQGENEQVGVKNVELAEEKEVLAEEKEVPAEEKEVPVEEKEVPAEEEVPAGKEGPPVGDPEAVPGLCEEEE